jgi:hypothetical protein
MRDRTMAELYRVRMAARRRMLRRGARYLAVVHGKDSSIDRTLAARLYQQAGRLFVRLSHLG